LRVLLGAFGDAGHAFPVIALGRALRARGHDVHIQTWSNWQQDIEREGLGFAAAPEYHVFPTRERPLTPYEAVERATVTTRGLVRDLAPDVVVADILTLAPALAAELEGVPCATLIPHVDPRTAPGFPLYSIGARLPRTAPGRLLWERLGSALDGGLRLGRRELNETRERLGLAPLTHVHGGISRDLCLVGTFPQLEYPRPADAGRTTTHVVGPLQWEPPNGERVEPAGDPSWPVVLVAPSTAQDGEHRLVRGALEGLAGLPVRVLATTNRRLPIPAPAVPANTTLVDWLSYARTMPHCDAVLTHAGHGTVCRALSAGCTVIAAPAAGDMNENAARIAWAGAGVRIPRRLVGPRAIRLAVGRALEDAALRARARAIAGWLEEHDPGVRAAELLESFAAQRGTTRDVSPSPSS
jgi:UDP:flavonoid glycosyltransferase YjiC (YdhE family)